MLVTTFKLYFNIYIENQLYLYNAVNVAILNLEFGVLLLFFYENFHIKKLKKIIQTTPTYPPRKSYTECDICFIVYLLSSSHIFMYQSIHLIFSV